MTNPLLAKVRMPGGTFTLPSLGSFYTDGEVEFENANKPEVYVAPMVTHDEITLTSADKLLNGTAVDEVFARCIPAVKRPRDLLSIDVDYLMVALRVMSFGPGVDIEYNHGCEITGADGVTIPSKSYAYEVDIEQQILDKTKRISQESLERYSVTLSNGLHVKFVPLTYGQLLEVQQILDDASQLSIKVEAAERGPARDHLNDRLIQAHNRYFTTLMSSCIRSMDNISDVAMISEAVEAMAVSLRQELIDAYEGLDEWGQPRTVKIKCKHCGEEVETKIDMNPVSFFTARSRRAIATR